jgi:hypothetical protein
MAESTPFIRCVFDGEKYKRIPGVSIFRYPISCSGLLNAVNIRFSQTEGEVSPKKWDHVKRL